MLRRRGYSLCRHRWGVSAIYRGIAFSANAFERRYSASLAADFEEVTASARSSPKPNVINPFSNICIDTSNQTTPGQDLCRLLEHLSRLHLSEIDYTNVLDFIDDSIAALPHVDGTYMNSDLDIEVGLAQSRTRLDCDSPYYNSIYSVVPTIHQLLQIIEPLAASDPRFIQCYIFSSFHCKDLAALTILFRALCASSQDMSKTSAKSLAYILSAFISSYEVEQAKEIFNAIVGLPRRRQLDVRLLEGVLHTLVESDALFENIIYFYTRWTDAGCSRPSPRCIAILLDQYHRYGTDTDMQRVNGIISHWRLEKHHAIALTNWTHQIYKRQPFQRLKNVTDQDLHELRLIVAGTQYMDEVLDTYRGALEFLARYSTTTVLEKVVEDISRGKSWDVLFYASIADFYAYKGEFLLLFKYLQSVRHHLPFSSVHVQKLYHAFTNAYPYMASSFNTKFHQYISSSLAIPPETKSRISEILVLKQLNSKITPFNAQTDSSHGKPLKYSSHHWKVYPWAKSQWGATIPFKEESQFRLHTGFQEIIGRGVRPDRDMLDATYRRASPRDRGLLVTLYQRLRMYKYHKHVLQLYDLQMSHPNREQAIDAYENLGPFLLPSSRLVLCRILINKNLRVQAQILLKSIDDGQLTNKGKVQKFLYTIRNLMTDKQAAELAQTIDSFPVDEVVLSPYVYEQCCFFERKLSLRVCKHQRDDISQLSEEKQAEHTHRQETLETAHRKMKGLVADTNLRVNKDAEELAQIQVELFEFIECWASERYDTE